MPTELQKMSIRQVSLVDRGANARTFALLKRAGPAERSARNIRKDLPPTFASILGSREIYDWMPEALSALGQVVSAAIAGVPDDPTITPELRLDAVRNSIGQFGEQLLQRVADAIVAGPPAAVAKAGRSPLRGLL